MLHPLLRNLFLLCASPWYYAFPTYTVNVSGQFADKFRLILVVTIVTQLFCNSNFLKSCHNCRQTSNELHGYQNYYRAVDSFLEPGGPSGKFLKPGGPSGNFFYN